MVPRQPLEVDETETGLAASPLIDIDKTVAVFCTANSPALPADIAETIAFHLEAIDACIASLED